MPQFVAEGPHTPEECATAGPEFAKMPGSKELLDKTVWGCDFGKHHSWTIADFADENEAKGFVPEIFRDRFTVTPVTVYTYDQMMEAHEG